MFILRVAGFEEERVNRPENCRSLAIYSSSSSLKTDYAPSNWLYKSSITQIKLQEFYRATTLNALTVSLSSLHTHYFFIIWQLKLFFITAQIFDWISL